MVSLKLTSLLAAASAICLVSAHPGEIHDAIQVRREIELRDSLAIQHKRSLASCSNTLKHRSLETRAINRREAKLQQLRAARGLPNSRFSIS